MLEIDIAAKLFPNITTVIVQLLATGVMFILFKKYLWATVQDYFAKRADFIEKQITDAQGANEKAKQLMQESEEQARASVLEYRDIVEKARVDASKLKDEIVAEAKKEAEMKMSQAQREIEAEKTLAKQEMKEEMITIAMDVATKIMNKDMNTSDNKVLVEEFIEKVVN